MEETIKEYEVIVSERAKQMLVSHTAFLAAVSEAAAERLVSTFQETANSLKKMPYRGAWFNAEYVPQNKYRYLVFEKRYLLIYQVRELSVFVDYVLDCRQNYAWLLN